MDVRGILEVGGYTGTYPAWAEHPFYPACFLVEGPFNWHWKFTSFAEAEAEYVHLDADAS